MMTIVTVDHYNHIFLNSWAASQIELINMSTCCLACGMWGWDTALNTLLNCIDLLLTTAECRPLPLNHDTDTHTNG